MTILQIFYPVSTVIKSTVFSTPRSQMHFCLIIQYFVDCRLLETSCKSLQLRNYQYFDNKAYTSSDWQLEVVIHLPRYIQPKPPWPMDDPSFHSFLFMSVIISPAAKCSARRLFAGPCLPAWAAFTRGIFTIIQNKATFNIIILEVRKTFSLRKASVQQRCYSNSYLLQNLNKGHLLITIYTCSILLIIS